MKLQGRAEDLEQRRYFLASASRLKPGNIRGVYAILPLNILREMLEDRGNITACERLVDLADYV